MRPFKRRFMHPFTRFAWNPALAALALLCAAAMSDASAALVYKCAANGTISYSQMPCTGAEVLDVNDSRTDNQKADADAVTRRTADMANSLQWKRYASEIPVQRVTPRPVVVPVYTEPEPRHIVRRVVVSRPAVYRGHR